MASSIAMKRAPASASSLLKKFFQPICCCAVEPSSTTTRSLNTNASKVRDRDEEDRNIEVVCNPDRPSSRLRDSSFAGTFADSFDPFNPMRHLRQQLLSLMDQFTENPFLAASRGGTRASLRRGWDVKEDEKGLYLRIDMPGLSKENVKVCVEENMLIISGEEKFVQSDEVEEHGERYSSRIELPENVYKVEEIKAEMKNGVLKIVVPKMKLQEERKHVVQVKVE